MIFSKNAHKHHYFNEKRIFAVFRDLPRNYLYNICIFGHILLKNSVCNALEKTGTHFDLRLTIKGHFSFWSMKSDKMVRGDPYHRYRVTFLTPIFYAIIVKYIKFLDFWYNLEPFWAKFKLVILTFPDKSMISSMVWRPKTKNAS